jgi:two-component system response regulator FlrC
MGFFEQASGGTLFLDEIGEMPLELQAKLLRVLQEKQIYRVGATTPVSVNVRIIAATNVDLKYNIQNRLFREDLYFRLSGFNLAIGRLADRPADIEPLARIFVQKHSGEQRSSLSQSALQKLLTHSWPGNVRELENVIARAMVLHENYTIEASDIAFDDLGLGEPVQAGESENANSGATEQEAASHNPASRQSQRESSELHAILRALQVSTNREQAAEQLGISPRTLRQKLFEFRRAGHEVPRAYARS